MEYVIKDEDAQRMSKTAIVIMAIITLVSVLLGSVIGLFVGNLMFPPAG